MYTDATGRALRGLFLKCQKLKGLGYDSYCKLYDYLVVPVQDYGAEIWNIVNKKTTEKIHERAMRYYLGSSNSHSSSGSLWANGQVRC